MAGIRRHCGPANPPRGPSSETLWTVSSTNRPSPVRCPRFPGGVRCSISYPKSIGQIRENADTPSIHPSTRNGERSTVPPSHRVGRRGSGGGGSSEHHSRYGSFCPNRKGREGEHEGKEAAGRNTRGTRGRKRGAVHNAHPISRHRVSACHVLAASLRYSVFRSIPSRRAASDMLPPACSKAC